MLLPLKKNGKPAGRRQIHLLPHPTEQNRNIMCWRCFPIRQGGYIWGTSAIIRWVTSLQGFVVPKASMCCTQWAGMPLACQQKTHIERGAHPSWTRENIASMRVQLKSMGLAYDWDREFATCRRIITSEQLMFLKFLEKRRLPM